MSWYQTVIEQELNFRGYGWTWNEVIDQIVEHSSTCVEVFTKISFCPSYDEHHGILLGIPDYNSCLSKGHPSFGYFRHYLFQHSFNDETKMAICYNSFRVLLGFIIGNFVLTSMPRDIQCEESEEKEGEIEESYYYVFSLNECSRLPKSTRKYYSKGDSVQVALPNDNVVDLKKTVIIFSDIDGCFVENFGDKIGYDRIFLDGFQIAHERCRRAAIVWILFSKRIMCKDVRNLIAQYVWKTRDDLVWYQDLHQHRNPRLCHKKIKSYAE